MGSEQALNAALEAIVPGLEVWSSDRPYPIQVRGLVDGQRFYFRARFGWEFAVSNTPKDDPYGISFGLVQGWSCTGEYENEDHDAGDMPDADVVACVMEAVRLWRVQDKAPKQRAAWKTIDVVRLSTALLAYSIWLELDPSLYDADEVGKELERLGILEPEEWRPAPWLVSAIKSFHGSEAETRGKADAQ